VMIAVSIAKRSRTSMSVRISAGFYNGPAL
jgi:hypothetical protein